MDNWKDLDPAAVAGMFDARLKSVALSSNLPMLNGDEFYFLDPDRHHLSEIDLSAPGVRLLLGRNGSGKSTLLEQLGKGIAKFCGNLEVSWIFSLPTEALLDSWNDLVMENSNQPDFTQNIKDVEEFGYRVELPIMELLLFTVYRGADDLHDDLLEKLGFVNYPKEPLTGRFLLPYNDGINLGPAQSYSPRVHPALWVRAALTGGISQLSRFGGGSMWLGSPDDGFPILDSDYFLDQAEVAQSCGIAMEQFMVSVDEVEFRFVGESPEFRFLAPSPEQGPLHELLRLRLTLTTEFGDNEPAPKMSFPLDLWTEATDNRVGSAWFDFGISNSRSQALILANVEGHLLNSVNCTVIDLRGDGVAQLSAMWNRVIDSHLKVMVIRGTESASSDSGSDSSMSGSPAAGREHIIVDGYDRLNEFLLGLAEDLLELDIGVDGLRAFRPHEAGWSKVSSKPGGFFGSLDFGEEMQGRQILQSPKSRWMSELVLQWKQPITGSWLELESASQGQRDIILMLLAMAASPKGGVPASKDHLLLIDEFDQHLHQTVTSKFLEIAQRRALQWGTRAILSTHSAPILAHPSTRQLPRIFARRTVDGAFSYSQRPPETREQLAAELGVDLLSASAWYRMFVMVEGEHDEVVLQSLLTTGRGGEEVAGVELINARGTWAFEGIWNNVLRYFSAPVLVVHDKLDRRFEKAWAELKERAGRDGETMPRWVETDFHRMRVEIDDRSMKKKSRRGDDETDKMLKVVFSIFGGREGLPSARDVLRLTFHGIDSPDIIRLLPIDHFLDARRHGSWEAAEEWWGRQGKSNSWNEEFKKSLKLTTAAVRRALSKTQDGWHSELQRLYDVMTNLYHVGGPEERNG